MYVHTSEVELNLTASLACGPCKEISGDSTQHLKTSKLNVFVMNNTKCSSYGGCASFEFDGLTETQGNAAIYLNVVNGSTAHCQLNYPNPSVLIIKDSNYIGIEAYSALFHAEGKITLTNCFIWLNAYTTIRNNITNVIFDSCKSNISEISLSGIYESIMITRRNAEFCGLFNAEHTVPHLSSITYLVLSMSLFGL